MKTRSTRHGSAPRSAKPASRSSRAKRETSLSGRIMAMPRSKPGKPPKLDLTREERAELIARRLMSRSGPPLTTSDYCQLNAAISINLDGVPTDCRDVIDRAAEISAAWPVVSPAMRIDLIDAVEGAFYALMGHKPDYP